MTVRLHSYQEASSATDQRCPDVAPTTEYVHSRLPHPFFRDTAELAAISMAIRCLPLDLQGRQITIFSSNQAALLALS